jgi:hypothetical protein
MADNSPYAVNSITPNYAAPAAPSYGPPGFSQDLSMNGPALSAHTFGGDQYGQDAVSNNFAPDLSMNEPAPGAYTFGQDQYGQEAAPPSPNYGYYGDVSPTAFGAGLSTSSPWGAPSLPSNFAPAATVGEANAISQDVADTPREPDMMTTGLLPALSPMMSNFPAMDAHLDDLAFNQYAAPFPGADALNMTPQEYSQYFANLQKTDPRFAGYSPAALAEQAATLYKESHLNPQATNPTSGAYGLDQAWGTRKPTMVNAMTSAGFPNPNTGQWPAAPVGNQAQQDQMDAALTGLAADPNYARNMANLESDLSSGVSPYDASRNFDNGFEVSIPSTPGPAQTNALTHQAEAATMASNMVNDLASNMGSAAYSSDIGSVTNSINSALSNPDSIASASGIAPEDQSKFDAAIQTVQQQDPKMRDFAPLGVLMLGGLAAKAMGYNPLSGIKSVMSGAYNSFGGANAGDSTVAGGSGGGSPSPAPAVPGSYNLLSSSPTSPLVAAATAAPATTTPAATTGATGNSNFSRTLNTLPTDWANYGANPEHTYFTYGTG